MFWESKGWTRLSGYLITAISQIDPLFDIVPVLIPYKWAITAAGLLIGGVGHVNAISVKK